MNVRDGDGEFEMIETTDGDAVGLTLAGDLDLAVVERLRARLQFLADAGTPVSLDLSRLEFIDSSGLGVLVMYHQYACRGDWNMTINPQMTERVARTIRVSGLDSVFWP